MTDESVEININERSLSVIIMALGENQLRAILECKAAKAVWESCNLSMPEKSGE